MRMSRERAREAFRRANKGGYRLQNTVSEQLVAIANNDLGAAGVYWSEFGQEYKDELSKPNQIRDKFVATVKEALANRVDRAYFLSPEQRFAAEMFRVLSEYAAEANWDNQKEFEQVWQVYAGIRELVNYRLGKAEQRVSDLRERREELMARHDLPYRHASL